MKTLVILACVVGSIGIAQAAVRKPDPMPGASKDECVFISNIQNWRVLDSRHVVLYAPTAKRTYLMQLGMPISDLKFAFSVAFIDRDRNGMLCGRSPDGVIAADSIVRQPAFISGMTRLDETGLLALETHYNVKLTRGKGRKEPAQSRESAPSGTI